MPRSPDDAGRIDRRGRLEAVAALAVLPVGVVLAPCCALASFLSACMALLFTIILIADSASAFGPLLVGWLWLAAVALAYATVTAVEAMGELAWRPMLRAVSAVALVAAASPVLWVA